MARKFKQHILSIVIVLLALGAALMILLIRTPMDNQGRVEAIEIPRGASLTHITEILYDAGLIRSRTAFSLYARFKHVSHIVRAGEYEFDTSMPPFAILEKLVRGEIKGYAVTIPEGYTMNQVADAIIECKLPQGKNFLKAATDREFLDSLKIPGHTAEGYLFPDTYNFTRSMTEKDMLTLMVNLFRKRVTPEMIEEAHGAGLDLHKMVILASLIEKEAKIKSEKPLISAVFHNRLKKGMRLQCDPTTVYGLKDFEGPIKKSHLLNRKNPYNTYVISGLPPGPIANPGLDSIKAAINPAPVDYLYFVSRNDGSHQFSAKLAHHNTAVLKFRLNREKE